jgi:hypothetical protein
MCVYNLIHRAKGPEEAGRRPSASLVQRSSASHPADPQEGDAQTAPRTVNLIRKRGPLLLGGHRPHKNLLLSRGNTFSKNLRKQIIHTPRYKKYTNTNEFEAADPEVTRDMRRLRSDHPFSPSDILRPFYLLYLKSAEICDVRNFECCRC